MKKIAVLGSSGSIGINTLEVVRRYKERFTVELLAVNSNIALLKEQIEEFKPAAVAVNNEEAARDLAKQLSGCRIPIYSGSDGLLKAAAETDYDIFVGAMVGFSGLAPTIEAIKRGKRIALANKETLVVAGELVTHLCKKHNAELIPVDSEHGAIFQCLMGESHSEVANLHLTASGGPFLHVDYNELQKVTVSEALDHPTWQMGSKITIDSASLMNKGLEVIEAHWLFDIPPERINVVVHPQSIIHSMVEFVDGSFKAQLSVPDMKLPIQFALSYPERLPAEYVTTNLAEIGKLTFLEPDYKRFRCLSLAFEALSLKGTAACVLNAANEVAVAKFLQGQIAFTKIPEIIEESINKIEHHINPDLDTIFDCNRKTRFFADKLS
jgi:1-deoxy-D-xylulose-5-phosphate reductoisomerase